MVELPIDHKKINYDIGSTQYKNVEDWEFEQIQPSFEVIDRKKENSDVMSFQETGDLEILESLYHNRVPTLKRWARKNYYLADSVDDMFEEMTRVFIKSVHGYQYQYKCRVNDKVVLKKTPFNTYLFYSLDHYVKNLHSNKKAKKRRPIGLDDSVKDFVYSLDFDYGKNGNESTLKDLIPDSIGSECVDSMEKIYLEETLDVLAHEHPHIKTFLRKLSDGNTLASLLREYKIKEGILKVTTKDGKKLSNERCDKMIKKIIKENVKFESDFKLLNYYIENDTHLNYTIEMKKTKETDNIMKSIRKIRGNKLNFIDRIHGSS